MNKSNLKVCLVFFQPFRKCLTAWAPAWNKCTIIAPRQRFACDLTFSNDPTNIFRQDKSFITVL